MPEFWMFLEYQISRKPAPMLDFAMGLLSRLSLVRSQPGRPHQVTKHSYQFCIFGIEIQCFWNMACRDVP